MDRDCRGRNSSSSLKDFPVDLNFFWLRADVPRVAAEPSSILYRPSSGTLNFHSGPLLTFTPTATAKTFNIMFDPAAEWRRIVAILRTDSGIRLQIREFRLSANRFPLSRFVTLLLIELFTSA